MILPCTIVLMMFGVFFLLKILNHSDKTKAETGSFKKKKYLMTKTEFQFYKQLIHSLPANIVVMPKVGLKDIVSVESKDSRQRNSDWGKIKSKHIDFVLASLQSSEIIAGIELDDKTHHSERAQKSDEIKNAVFNSAGIPLYRFWVNNHYSFDDMLLKLEVKNS